MRSFTLILLLLLSSLASGANIRSTFIATNGTVIVNSTDLTAPQEAVFIDWLWAMYAPVDAEGVTLPRNNANVAQAYRNYAKAIHAGTYAQARRWKREQGQAAIVEPTLPPE